ncbi:MAG TPA: class A beta-lactamase, subclass A2 [Alistipes sp.]|nr:class A beta-lactamase, subclass A2 [Alistipes sp.]HAY30255.1 class A beta-lactamase, subclass A2 [Alistipes sp.]
MTAETVRRIAAYGCLTAVCLFAALCATAKPQCGTLVRQIDSVLSRYRATVGVTVLSNRDEIVAANDSILFPLMSVFKFHIALAVLDRMDRNRTRLDSVVRIKASDMHPDTYSPLRERHPGRDFSITIAELLRYSVAHSDNNACDILLEYAGGPEVVEKYVRGLGIENTFISASEKTMHDRIENQYLNRSTPTATARLIETFFENRLFASKYKKFLIRIMTETSTGQDKLKGLLPPDCTVGHKTGSSDRTSTGVKIADNDAGFVLTPDGKRYYIAVFVSDSQEDDPTNASIIARISAIVYDFMIRPTDPNVRRFAAPKACRSTMRPGVRKKESALPNKQALFFLTLVATPQVAGSGTYAQKFGNTTFIRTDDSNKKTKPGYHPPGLSAHGSEKPNPLNFPGRIPTISIAVKSERTRPRDALRRVRRQAFPRGKPPDVHL